MYPSQLARQYLSVAVSKRWNGSDCGTDPIFR